MVSARHVIFQIFVVCVENLMTLRIPEITVAVFFICYGEADFVMVVDGKIERGLTIAAVCVNIMMRVDGAFVERHVHIVGIVLPTVTVATGFMHFNVITWSELKVEDEGAVACVGKGKCVVKGTRFVIGPAV